MTSDETKIGLDEFKNVGGKAEVYSASVHDDGTMTVSVMATLRGRFTLDARNEVFLSMRRYIDARKDER